MVVNIDLLYRDKNEYKKGDIVVTKRKDRSGGTYYYQIVYYPHIDGRYGLVYLNLMDFDKKYIASSPNKCVEILLEKVNTLEVVDVIKAEDILITTKCN